MRFFIALPLSDEVVTELESFCGRLRSSSDGLRWSAAESWHITLQFLGNSQPAQYERLIAQLRTLQSPPIRIQLGDCGFFDRARIFYAGIELTPMLISLQEHVTEVTARCGFAAESRIFQPHITLARSKGKERSQLSALKRRLSLKPRFSGFSACEFLLYESHLSAEGSIYEVRARFPLGQPDEIR